MVEEADNLAPGAELAVTGENKPAGKKVRQHMMVLVAQLTRKELYDEVWTISVAGVAKKYDIPYAKCLLQVKAANIPVPPAGYWTKIGFGKPVEKVPLQGEQDEIVTLSKESAEKSVSKSRKTDALSPGKEEKAPSHSVTPLDCEAVPEETAQVEVSQQIATPPETVQQYGQTYNVYDREILYQEVWAAPVTEVAKRYQVSDVAIHKVCKALEIPTPPQGYWAKLRAGKPVKRTPLPPSNQKKKLGVQTGIAPRVEQEVIPLAFLDEEERQVVMNVAAQILIPDENTRMLPEIIAHRKKIVEWDKERRKQERDSWGARNRRNKEDTPAFAEGISEEQRLRVFRIINALAKAMNPLGCKLTSDLKFVVNQETVALVFSEAKDQIPHIPTKEDNIRLLQYEEERKKYSWAHKPQIRKYDSVYNGHLSVTVGAKSFRDCKSYVLEDRLGDIMLSIYEEAGRLRQARLAREEAERLWQEEKRREEEFRERYNVEVERTLALVNCAEDYETACRIRSYASAMEKAHPDQDLSEWIAWAQAKADWYDPTLAREDEILGKRKHEADRETKGPKFKGYWR